MYFDRDSYQKSVRRAREERWRVRGRARVVHPKYGAVVVPHRSNYSALLNAAEYWGCEWTDIRDAEVWAVSHSTAVVQPGSVLCLMNRMRYCGTHAEEEPRRQRGDYCQYCGHRLREIGRERFCNNVNCRNRYVNV